MTADHEGRDGPLPSRRDRILAAATREFARRGYEGATWRAIAEAAGVNQSLIRFYFTDKEGLWRAAFREVQAEREAGMPPPAIVPGQPEVDPAAMEAWLRAFTRHVARNPEQARMMVQEGVQGSERAAWAVEDTLARAHEEFLAGVALLQARGWFVGFDPRALLYLMVGAAQYRFLVPSEVQALTGTDPLSDEEVERYAEAVVRLFMTHGPR